MPARYAIYIFIDQYEDNVLAPFIEWLEFPLPKGSQSVVQVSVEHTKLKRARTWSPRFDEALELYRSLRGDMPDWLPLFFGGGSIANDFFEQDAVTKLTYDWIRNDLKKLKIVDC
jgi:hypothetical protein